jgi:hypothetical protein
MSIIYQRPEKAENGFYLFPREFSREISYRSTKEFPSLEDAVKRQDTVMNTTERLVSKLNQHDNIFGWVNFFTQIAIAKKRWFVPEWASLSIGSYAIPIIEFINLNSGGYYSKEKISVYTSNPQHIIIEPHGNVAHDICEEVKEQESEVCIVINSLGFLRLRKWKK